MTKKLISLEEFNNTPKKLKTTPNGIACPMCNEELHDCTEATALWDVGHTVKNGLPIMCVKEKCNYKGTRKYRDPRWF